MSGDSAGEDFEAGFGDEGVDGFEHRGLVVVFEVGEVGEFVAEDVLGDVVVTDRAGNNLAI